MKNQKSFELDTMLADGYTRRFAMFYKNLAEAEYSKGLWSKDEIDWAHARGFLADKIAAYDLNDENYQDYLSDYDYYKLWPLNSPYRIWINDKLTLKYILPDNLYGKYLPKYYHYTEDRGIINLLDCTQSTGTSDSVIATLKEHGELAMKLVNGTASNNFYRLSYSGNSLQVNSQDISDQEFRGFLQKHKYYVITEYLRPQKDMAAIFDKIHTLRLVVVNEHGNDPYIAGGYLRFGTNAHGEANHINLSADCNAAFDYYTAIDCETGKFDNGYKVWSNHVETCPCHPDTGILAAGRIQCWDELKSTVLSMSKYLFACEWFGYDIGITDDGFKLMEINSHSGIGYLQFFESLYKNERTRNYLQKRLQMIDSMTPEEKAVRNNILR